MCTNKKDLIQQDSCFCHDTFIKLNETDQKAPTTNTLAPALWDHPSMAIKQCLAVRSLNL